MGVADGMLERVSGQDAPAKTSCACQGQPGAARRSQLARCFRQTNDVMPWNALPPMGLLSANHRIRQARW